MADKGNAGHGGLTTPRPARADDVAPDTDPGIWDDGPNPLHARSVTRDGDAAGDSTEALPRPVRSASSSTVPR